MPRIIEIKINNMEDDTLKKSIGLVADAGVDLPNDLLEKHNISTAPFKIYLGELEKFAGNLYEKMREAEKNGISSIVKTSQPSIMDFLVKFKEKLLNYKDVICITLSSKISGAFNSATQAKKFLPAEAQEHVIVVDSKFGSSAEGLLMMAVAELVERGATLKEILEKIPKFIGKMHLITVVEDPKWLKASGRVSKIVTMGIKQMQQSMKAQLIFGIKGGRILPLGVVKNVTDVVSTLSVGIQERIPNVASKFVFSITHAGDAAGAVKLRDFIKNRFPSSVFSFIGLTCDTFGGQMGPGTISVSWMEI